MLRILSTRCRCPRCGVRLWARSTVLAAVVGVVATVPTAAEPGKRVEMTLRQAVEAAVTHSRAVSASYLARAASANQLTVAEDRYRPDLEISGRSLGGGHTTRQAGRTDAASRRGEIGAEADLRLAIKTGGSLSYSWSTSVDDASAADAGYRLGHALRVRQPLLQGRGVRVDTAGQEQARIGDRLAALALEATIADIVNATIFAYRDLLAAREEVAISRRSLEAARELRTITDALIESGRLPEVERIQSDTDIANRELQLLVTENAADSAQLRLLATLDLDLDSEIVPVDPVPVERRELTYDEALQLLLTRQPEYRAFLLRLELTRLDHVQAVDGRRLALDLVAQASQDRTGASSTVATTQSDWSVAVTVGRLFGDRSRDARVTAARLALEQDALALTEVQENIRIDLQERLRNLEVAARRVTLANRARELSERQLDIEKDKLHAGRSASFQVVRFQDDVDDARNRELAAAIAYANELTNLERFIGTTLEVWSLATDQRPTAATTLAPPSSSPSWSARSRGPELEVP